ncbi:hypothetical protein F5B17DRAFT_13771 [Nemania serpens]|nr:hypothetical protein F5B17DRAFT_13771 [Nemania serpens]
MANVDTGTAPRRTISDYYLSRQADEPRLTAMGFMDPYMNQLGENGPVAWASFTIRDPERREIVLYSVSTLFNAYVTEIAFLTTEDDDDDARLTPTRYRDMMLDSYLDAGGDLKTWRYIGVMAVIHDGTRDAALAYFRLVGKDPNEAGTVEALPDDEEFLSIALANPFGGGVRRLLRQYEEEMGHARIKKVIFISLGVTPGAVVTIDHPVIDLVIELCRPGDDGYPDGQVS